MMLKHIAWYIRNNPAYRANLNPTDPRYKAFQERGPKGVILHSIGVPQPSAERIAQNFDRADATASVHRIIDAEGRCYQLAPDHYRMWHVGGKANETHMGIEMTEPSCIAYDEENGYKLHIRNRSEALRYVVETYKHAVELFAELCITHGWNPLEDGVILSHRECYERGLGSNHGDPEHLWEALDTGYTMGGFRRAVAARVESMKAERIEAKVEEAVARVLARMNSEQSDNDAQKWSKEARQWAIENGIVSGVGSLPDGTPNYAWQMPITREQLVTILHRVVVKSLG